MHQAGQLVRAGYPRRAALLRKQAKLLPRGDPFDPDYRRLHYVRYADDWLLGFIGPRSEAEASIVGSTRPSSEALSSTTDWRLTCVVSTV
jgi:hypothetical protein